MSSRFHLRRAVHALRKGGVIAYPTETVYGLGCDPLDMHAVEHVLEYKKRPQDKGLILIAANLAQLQSYIDVDDEALLAKISTPSERPTTWICPIQDTTPDYLCGRHNSIAVRISPSRLVQRLCTEFGGAIVSTSANPSGKAPATNDMMIQRYFGDRLDYVLNGSSTRRGRPSRIIDLLSGRIVRD